ncbi:MAG: T9SS type A sorting domain-containing protein [Rhodothermaceae bacterium]|nr:T9SS type A sorting domain-containing protein [Rhodothermaceae bacterium]
MDFVTPDLGYVADQGRILRTADGGDTWTFEDRPFDHAMLPRAVAAYDANRSLVVGTSGGIRLTTSGGGFPVAVVANEPTEPVATPTTFALDQNYPNPFTGRTTLAYALDAPDRVTLIVYDLLGREIARLVDETQAPGRHTVPFEARDLASGVYLVRLHVGEQAATRRMMHVR